MIVLPVSFPADTLILAYFWPHVKPDGKREDDLESPQPKMILKKMTFEATPTAPLARHVDTTRPGR